jgi:predicted ester cyclase
MSHNNQQNKQIVWNLWQWLNHASTDDLGNILKGAVHHDVAWHGPHPINQIDGLDNVVADFWEPLRKSFPDLKRTCDVFIGGETLGEDWVTSTGYFTGTFDNDWLSIPATRQKTYIRYGQFCVMVDSKISESYLILDLLDVMRQAGFQLVRPARGAEGGRVPPPRPNDGVKLFAQDELESQQSSQLVWAMIGGMGRYDRKTLASMEQEHYWHPQFRWYGPSGIGTSRSLVEYQEFHQGPWISAFPDRGGALQGPGRTMGFVAEGMYVAGGIWDRPYATHTGNFLGFKPTGKQFIFRDFDWWRREGDFIVENWVPMDLIHLLLQLDIDIFARLEEKIETGGQWY